MGEKRTAAGDPIQARTFLVDSRGNRPAVSYVQRLQCIKLELKLSAGFRPSSATSVPVTRARLARRSRSARRNNME
jgi:hypothetical protein